MFYVVLFRLFLLWLPSCIYAVTTSPICARHSLNIFCTLTFNHFHCSHLCNHAKLLHIPLICRCLLFFGILSTQTLVFLVFFRCHMSPPYRSFFGREGGFFCLPWIFMFLHVIELTSTFMKMDRVLDVLLYIFRSSCISLANHSPLFALSTSTPSVAS